MTGTVWTASAQSSAATSSISRAMRSRPTSTWRTERRATATRTTSSSTTGRPGSFQRLILPINLEVAAKPPERLKARREAEGRRRVHIRRRDLDGDHLMRLEHDGARVAGVGLGALAVPQVDVHHDLVLGCHGEGRNVFGVQLLGLTAVGPAPRVPYVEELAEGERIAGR